MTAAVPKEKVTAISKANETPQFDTHVPFIGTVDLQSPVEWLWGGALALNILFVGGMTKWVIAAGILAARYEVKKRCQS